MTKILKWIIIGILSVVFVYAAYQIISTQLDYRQGEQIYENLMDTYVTVGAAQSSDAEAENEVPEAVTSGEKAADAQRADSEALGEENGSSTATAQSGEAEDGTDPDTDRETAADAGAASDRGEEAESDTADAAADTPEVYDDPGISVDFAGLRSVNEDIVAWLYQPDTVISYPVLQSADNADYLRHLPDGTYRQAGSLFIDYQCDGFSGLNTIIYGHNLKDGSMFCSLVSYKNQSYYDAHPEFYLLTEDVSFVLYPIAGFVTDADSDSYQHFETDEALQTYLEKCTTKSTFNADSDLSEVHQIITLSTCEYSSGTARYVLICQPVRIVR